MGLSDIKVLGGAKVVAEQVKLWVFLLNERHIMGFIPGRKRFQER
jgi:hypothetical protein